MSYDDARLDDNNDNANDNDNGEKNDDDGYDDDYHLRIGDKNWIYKTNDKW